MQNLQKKYLVKSGVLNINVYSRDFFSSMPTWFVCFFLLLEREEENVRIDEGRFCVRPPWGIKEMKKERERERDCLCRCLWGCGHLFFHASSLSSSCSSSLHPLYYSLFRLCFASFVTALRISISRVWVQWTSAGWWKPKFVYSF